MEFERVTPEQVGISSKGILAFIEETQRRSIEMHSLMVLRHGKICAEGWWAPYAPDIKHAMFSFSKSLTSTAIGFAEQEGLLTLDEKLVDLFPDKCPANPSENLKQADLYSLLTMSCGHEKEPGVFGQEDPEWIKGFLHHDFKYKPGTMFQYNTAGTNMLAAVLQKKTGMTLTQYLKPRLLDPLGMKDVYCQALPDGVEHGGSGYFLATEDMARFIQFWLQKGVWEGKRLLNEAWFDKASAKQIETDNPVYAPTIDNWQKGYGFQFWRCVPEGIYRADGAYGQFGIVIPEKDAAIIISSASLATNDLLNICWATILPAITDESCLPADAAADTLKHTLANLKLPVTWGPRSPLAEEKVGGARFEARETLPGLVDIVGGTSRRPDKGEQLCAICLAFDQYGVRLCAEQKKGNIELYASFTGDTHMNLVGGKHYAAAARWYSETCLEMEVRCVEMANGARVRLLFGDDSLRLEVCSTLPTPSRLEGENGPALVLYRA